MEPTYLACTGTCEAIRATVLSIVIFFSLTGAFAYTTLLERRFISAIQSRKGPNRVGPFGLFQPIADGIKLIFKEDITPRMADRVVFWLAPVITAVPAVIVLAVTPLAPSIPIWIGGYWYVIPLTLADVNVGLIYFLAVTSIAIYGIVLAGWSSANKYSLLGGIRASAQMISYELSLGTIIAVPILIAGAMSFGKIIDAQFDLGWFFLHNPLAAFIMAVALLAEVNRAPFDLPEAEQELTAGYHTEYSGMKFALFFMAEYIKMAAVSLIFFSLFFGGYLGPLVDSDYATGQVALQNNTGAEMTIPQGTVIYNETDDPAYQVFFETTDDLTLAPGLSDFVPIEAHIRSPGLVGNVPAGTLNRVEMEDVAIVQTDPTTGGGQSFVLGPILGGIYLVLKVVFSLMLMVWLRATFPRLRYDQLMAFGWKVMLPLALLAVAWTAVSLVLGDEAGSSLVYAGMSALQWLLLGGFIVFSTWRSLGGGQLRRQRLPVAGRLVSPEE